MTGTKRSKVSVKWRNSCQRPEEKFKCPEWALEGKKKRMNDLMLLFSCHPGVHPLVNPGHVDARVDKSSCSIYQPPHDRDQVNCAPASAGGAKELSACATSTYIRHDRGLRPTGARFPVCHSSFQIAPFK